MHTCVHAWNLHVLHSSYQLYTEQVLLLISFTLSIPQRLMLQVETIVQLETRGGMRRTGRAGGVIWGPDVCSLAAEQ